MLADQFEALERTLKRHGAEDAERWLTDGLFQTGKLVKEAFRFTLDRSAVMMVQNIALHSYGTISKALPICRLPAPLMWVEFPFKYRADWLAEAVTHGHKTSEIADASPPVHLGFLLSEIPRQGPVGPFLTIQASWIHKEPTVDISRQVVIIDLSPDPIAAGSQRQYVQECLADPAKMRAEGHKTVDDLYGFANLIERIRYVEAPGCESYWEEAKRRGPQFYKKCLERSAYDLAQEWRFILSLLIMLNSRNLATFGAMEDYAKLNKSRLKSGKAPLLSHRPIQLSLSKVQKNRIARGYAGPGAKPTEAQWVIGHFKVRKTGVYWWSMHERGGEAATKRVHAITG